MVADRSNNVSHFEVFDCRSQPNDLGGGIRAWNALFSVRHRVFCHQHSNVAVVERYSVNLDNHIVGTEFLLLR